MEEDIDTFLRRVSVEPPPNATMLLQRQGSFQTAQSSSPNATLPLSQVPRPQTPPLPNNQNSVARPPAANNSNFSWNSADDEGATLIPSSSVSALSPMRAVIITLQSTDPMFPTLSKELIKPIRVGRHMGAESDADQFFIGYETKVVSRMHAEIFAQGVDVFVKDLASKSGTFINGKRLSIAGKESPPVQINHGDTLQFGVDFQDRNIKEQRAVIVTASLSSGRSLSQNALSSPMQPMQQPTNPHIANLKITRKNSLTSLEDLQPPGSHMSYSGQAPYGALPKPITSPPSNPPGQLPSGLPRGQVSLTNLTMIGEVQKY